MPGTEDLALALGAKAFVRKPSNALDLPGAIRAGLDAEPACNVA